MGLSDPALSPFLAHAVLPPILWGPPVAACSHFLEQAMLFPTQDLVLK